MLAVGRGSARATGRSVQGSLEVGPCSKDLLRDLGRASLVAASEGLHRLLLHVAGALVGLPWQAWLLLLQLLAVGGRLVAAAGATRTGGWRSTPVTTPEKNWNGL